MAYPELAAKPLRPSVLSMDGISRHMIEEHYKLYQGYVNKVNEIMKKLGSVDRSTANQTYSDLRELKLELSFALGGVKSHETYFGHLGGHGGQPHGDLLAMIQRDFGSYENWAADLKQTGVAARGWVWLAYDWDYGQLFNFLGDGHNTYPIWNASVLLALDTYEHAYFIDYGTGRPAYIDAFLRNLDWDVVAGRFESLHVD